MPKKTTKEVRVEGLDKFYTKPEIANNCINILTSFYNWNEWDYVIEPSAGNGNFFHSIPVQSKIGMDICPEHPDIIEKNFFDYSPETVNNILCIGNPPFGKNSSIAIKFFNYSAKWCNTIAFIVPRTFRRVSIQNKLDMNFHLIHDSDIPQYPCSFEPQMSVKCCFQIWKRKSYTREKCVLQTSHPDWEFLQYTKDENNNLIYPNNADFALRAYGGECGEIKIENFQQLKPKSWHWIRSNIQKSILISRFQKIDYSISKNTARQNSIGKGDLVCLYKAFIDSESQ